MWLSKRLKEEQSRPATAADLGVTTIGGARAGVYARGEVRDLPVCAPGGMVWQPRSGDAVVVLKGGPGGEERCILGVQRQSDPEELADGEVYLYTDGGASIRLCGDGSVIINGRVIINGEAYTPCTCEVEIPVGG